MNIFKEIYLGLTYHGELPQTAVSDNRHLYGRQGQKHLDETGAPGLLNQATGRDEYKASLSHKEQASSTDWNQQRQLAQLAAGRRPLST